MTMHDQPAPKTHGFAADRADTGLPRTSCHAAYGVLVTGLLVTAASLCGVGRGFWSGQRGAQEALGAFGQFPDYVCGWHYLCHQLG
jgi:hypothetical protein